MFAASIHSQVFREYRGSGESSDKAKKIAVYFMANIPSIFSVVVCFVVLTQWKKKTNDKTMENSGICIIWLERFDDAAAFQYYVFQ